MKRAADVSTMPLLVTVRDAARLLAVTPACLAKWRREGQGPPWVKFQRGIRYRVGAIERWLDTRENGRSSSNS